MWRPGGGGGQEEGGGRREGNIVSNTAFVVLEGKGRATMKCTKVKLAPNACHFVKLWQLVSMLLGEAHGRALLGD